MKINVKMPESLMKPLVRLKWNSLLEASHVESLGPNSELFQVSLLSSQYVLNSGLQGLKVWA